MKGLYREQGIVLRGYKLGEADRILSVFTQSSGKIRVVAKGVRQTKSRIGSRLDPFNHVDLQLYAGRDLDIVNQVEIIGRYPRLRDDYQAFMAASAIVDTVDQTTADRDRNVGLFLLFKSALEALQEGCSDPGLLAYAFLAKASSIAGVRPMLDRCVGCGASSPVAISFVSGGVVCPSCADPADPRVTAELLEMWLSLLTEDWPALSSFDVDQDLQTEVSALLLGFVGWQLDNRFRAFDLLRTNH